VGGSLGSLGVAAGALKDHVHPQLPPGQKRDIRGGEDLDRVPVYDELAFARAHLSRPDAVHAVVFHEVGQGGGVGEVVHGRYLQVGPSF
jgi:hypothetical protein